MAPRVRSGRCKAGKGLKAWARAGALRSNTVSQGSLAGLRWAVICTLALCCKSTSAMRPAACAVVGSKDTSAQRQAPAQATRWAVPDNCRPAAVAWMLGWLALNWPAVSSSIKVIGPCGISSPANDSSCAATSVSASGNGTCQWPTPRRMG